MRKTCGWCPTHRPPNDLTEPRVTGVLLTGCPNCDDIQEVYLCGQHYTEAKLYSYGCISCDETYVEHLLGKLP